MTTEQAVPIRTGTHGNVPEGATEFAAAKVRSILHHIPQPILSARVTLTMSADPAVGLPAVAQAIVDVNGRVAQAEAAGATMRDAIERMADRLRARLDRMRQRAAPRTAVPARRPREGQGEPSSVIRRASYASRPMTVAEAGAELDLLDYQFLLFIEQSTGQDAVIYRAGGHCRVALAQPDRGIPGPVPGWVTVSQQSAPRITVADATGRLEALGTPFVFFIDAATGRGGLVYHRPDGQYGMVEREG